jgi:myo-inositol-1-phosphate synthase
MTARQIAPATGKLGVLTPGMGAVASTFIAGVIAARKGIHPPIGSISQMAHIRLGTKDENRNPMIKDFAPLASLDDIVFGGWDPISPNALEAARTAGVLSNEDLNEISSELEAIVPMEAVFDQRWVSRLDGVRVKQIDSKWDQAQALIDDIANFKEANGCDRLVMVWCGSTEAYQEPSSVHESVAAFEQGLRDNDANISPSQIYVYAALQSDVPFANGAPNLSVDLDCMIELSKTRNVPIAGKDFKTGQTWMKTILAPGLKARMLGLRGWYSTNILGNRDGEVLDDPENFKSKEVSDPAARGVPGPVRQHRPRRADQLLPAPWRQQGGLGQPRHLRLARLPDADQGRLPVPRLDPRRADRARPGDLHGPRDARWRERRAGMVELLPQGAAGCRREPGGERPVHPADEAEEHPA